MNFTARKSIQMPPHAPSAWSKCAVVLASVACHLITNTCQLSFITLYQDFIESKAVLHAPDISFVTLLSSALFLVSSSLYGLVLHRDNLNRVAIFSSILSSTALLVGSFSKNIDYYIFSVSLLTGVGLSGLHLASIAALSFTFRSRFPLILGLVLCLSKASQFLHEPLTDLLISTYQWDGTCQIMAALCLNGVACGLVFSAPNNITSLGLEWVFYCPSFKNKLKCNSRSYQEKDFKSSFVIQAILRAKEKQKDESNKSLDGCIITNSNTILKPPSTEQLCSEEDTTSQSTHHSQYSLQSSPITLPSSSTSHNSLSYCSLHSFLHTETFQKSPSTFQYSNEPHHSSLKKIPSTSPSMHNVHNFKRTFKCLSYLIFNASFIFAYIGTFIPSSFLMRRVFSQGFSIEKIHTIYLLSTCSEMLNCLSVGLLLQLKRPQATVLYTGLLLTTGLLVLLLIWPLHLPSLVVFTLLFGFSKAGQAVLRPVLLRALYGGGSFVQTFSLSHLFEAVAATTAPLTADVLKRHSVSFEWVFGAAGGLLFAASAISALVKCVRRREEKTESGEQAGNVKPLQENNTVTELFIQVFK